MEKFSIVVLMLVLYDDRSAIKGFTISFLTLGFTFSEVRSIPAGTSKIECCNFSRDGKLLATGGHDRKVTFG